MRACTKLRSGESPEAVTIQIASVGTTYLLRRSDNRSAAHAAQGDLSGKFLHSCQSCWNEGFCLNLFISSTYLNLKSVCPWVHNVLLGWVTYDRVSEGTLRGKTVAKILRGSFLVAVPCAIFAGPTLAAIKLGSSHLSQLAESSRAFEPASLMVLGAGFLSIASAIRRWQSSIA
jgi:hypothetical protein